MRTSFVKMALAAMAVIGLLYQPAKAGDWTVKVTPQNSPVGAPIIEVESDGEEWTNIRSATHQLKLSVEVEVSSGYRITKVYLGFSSADFCSSSVGSPPAEGCITAYTGKTKHVKLDGRTHEFSTDQIGGIDAQAIVNACNAGGHDPTQERDPFESDIGVGIKAYIPTRKEANDFQEGDVGRTETAYARAPVIVRCLAGPSKIQAPPEPFSVDVLVQQKGETCPKETEVTARIKYHEPATARFRFKLDGELSELITIEARKLGGQHGAPNLPGKKGVYLVERLKTYHLDPGQHHFRVELQGGKKSDVKTLKIECPPFQATSMWLALNTENKSTCPKNVDASVRINANRPGSVLTKIKNQAGVVMAIEGIKVKREGDQYVGRLTKTFNMTAIDTMLIAEDANDSATNSGWQPLKIECLEALSGKLTLQSLGATSCKGEALVAIHTDGAGELPYELECGPGKSWQRKVTAMANKIGVDKVRFDVTNNEQVTCALRTRIGGVLKPLDGASMTFQCHKPIDTGADDLAPDTRPEDPPPVGDTLTGDFSFVDIGGTRCPRQGKALISFKSSKPDNVHYSLDCTNGSFSGVAQTAPSPKGGFIAPALVSFDIEKTTKANCALKSVAPGKPKVHTLKGHTFQCVGRTDVGGPEDLAPDTRPDPQRPDKPGTAVVDPPRPTISCTNGTVKDGACVCEPTHKPVKAGKNAWRCVQLVTDPKPDQATVSEPKISCAGGAVKDGACVCERTHKPVKAGKNAWRCVKVAVDPKPDKPIVSEPKISCAGGTVKNGACACARTHKPVKAGQNAWRCVKAVGDPPRNKDGANKLELKTAPKKTATPKLGVSDKGNGGKGKGKAAKKGNGSSASR